MDACVHFQNKTLAKQIVFTFVISKLKLRLDSDNFVVLFYFDSFSFSDLT